MTLELFHDSILLVHGLLFMVPNGFLCTHLCRIVAPHDAAVKAEREHSRVLGAPPTVRVHQNVHPAVLGAPFNDLLSRCRDRRSPGLGILLPKLARCPPNLHGIDWSEDTHPPVQWRVHVLVSRRLGETDDHAAGGQEGAVAVQGSGDAQGADNDKDESEEACDDAWRRRRASIRRRTLWGRKCWW